MLRLSRLLPILVAATWVGATAHTADAQEQTASEVALAREQLTAGESSAAKGDWESARQSFHRAYRIVPAPKTLLLLARAQEETGRLVEAIQSLHTLLAASEAGQPGTERSAISARVSALERKIGRIEITLSSARKNDSLLLDGRVLSRAVVGAPLPIDPGSHLLQVLRRGREVRRKEFVVKPGETIPIDITAKPKPYAHSQVNPVTVPAEKPEESKVAESPVLWIILGAVVVGSAVTAGVLLSSSVGDPYAGSTGVVVRAQRVWGP